jgi:hypothetical protein
VLLVLCVLLATTLAEAELPTLVPAMAPAPLEVAATGLL